MKDKYGMECFKIKVNSLNEFEESYGLKTGEYLADNYNEDFYMLRNTGFFGCIVRKEQADIIQ